LQAGFAGRTLGGVSDGWRHVIPFGSGKVDCGGAPQCGVRGGVAGLMELQVGTT
jgi:hypothetical protein